MTQGSGWECRQECGQGFVQECGRTTVLVSSLAVLPSLLCAGNHLDNALLLVRSGPLPLLPLLLHDTADSHRHTLHTAAGGGRRMLVLDGPRSGGVGAWNWATVVCRACCQPLRREKTSGKGSSARSAAGR